MIISTMMKFVYGVSLCSFPCCSKCKVNKHIYVKLSLYSIEPERENLVD